MTIVNRERYSCSARRERGTCDSPTSIAAVDLENRVLDGLRSILLGRDDLIAEFAAAFKAELNRLQKTRHTRERAHAKELTKIEHGIRRCLDYIVEGDGDPGAVRHTLQGLEARKEAILRDMKAANDIAEVVIHPNIAELYRRKVEELQTLLTNETSRPQAMEIIRSLIDRIEISPGAKRGHAEVLLVGALASILDYASSPTAQTQNAASGGERRTPPLVEAACVGS